MTGKRSLIRHGRPRACHPCPRAPDPGVWQHRTGIDGRHNPGRDGKTCDAALFQRLWGRSRPQSKSERPVTPRHGLPVTATRIAAAGRDPHGARAASRTASARDTPISASRCGSRSRRSRRVVATCQAWVNARASACHAGRGNAGSPTARCGSERSDIGKILQTHR